MVDELSDHLLALARDECYRVDEVLKCGPYEKTERVYFVGVNGAEQGPYIRKYFEAEVGLGSVYDQLQGAQKMGRRFVHLPTIFDCYRMDNKRVVVMEFISGETLDEVIYRCDPSLELAFDVFLRLCDAVEELHEAFDPCIIHRDLKPSNIMLTGNNVTIIDFGIARIYDQNASRDTLHFGTRSYAPPEQFGFGQTDRRSDVYALGMLLYYCLTERTPDARMRAKKFCDPAVPEALRQIILQASAFDPDKRYSSVACLRRAVVEAKAYLIAQPEELAPPSPPAWSRELAPANQIKPQEAQFEPPQFDPPDPSQLQRSEPSGRARRWMSSPVVKKIGVVWDFLLGIVLLFFGFTCIVSALDPRPNTSEAAASLSLRLLVYAEIFLFIFVPAAMLICDRRPLRPFLPFLRKGVVAQILVPLLVFIGGIVLVGLSAKFIGK